MSRKLTKEEFIAEFKSKFPNKHFDFKKSDYKNSKTKIIVTCPIHGDFFIRPNDLMNGMGCPKCGGTHTYDTDEFIKRANLVHNGFFSYTKVEYTGSHNKVIITCPIHGDFKQKANNHLQGMGCLKCKREGIKHAAHPLPKLNKTSKKITTELFIEKAKQIHGNKYEYNDTIYKRANKKVIVTCKEHGGFEITPNHFLSGRGCPICGRNKPLTTEEFIHRANDVHNNSYDYSKATYASTHKDVIIICPTHGEFRQSPANHLRGQGCPLCANFKMEEEIAKLLDENGIVYQRQKRFPWLGRQSLDFFIPSLNIAIECQGEQHFSPVDFGGKGEDYAKEFFVKICENDTLKHTLCQENNITLLYYSNLSRKFPYFVFTDKERLLEKFFKNGNI